MRRRTIDTDRSRCSGPGQGVGDDAATTGDIPDVNLLPRQDVGSFEEIGVDRHAALVIEVSTRDGRSVYL